LLLFVVASLALSVDYSRQEFKKFQEKYGKSYSPEEESLRFQIFAENLAFINSHNAQIPKPSFTVAVNKFADLSNEEFVQKYTGFHAQRGPARKTHSWSVGAIPTSFDWRDSNAVTEVKDQGQCGSCWSFSTTGAIEGAWAIAKTTLVSLSEQNILDCSWNAPYNNTGCDGGDMREAMQYVIDNHGIDTEDSYPYNDYNGGDQEPCTYSAANSAASIRSFVDVISGNETDLLVAAYVGPVSIAIDASQSSFQFYDGGVYSDPMCQNDLADLDHGVLVVGFDSYNEFWIVKNSWGMDWGTEGYILMAMNDDNMCGIATYATLPKV